MTDTHTQRALALAAALLLALFAVDAWWALSGASDAVDRFALVWLRDPVDVRNLRVPGWTLLAAIGITDVGGARIRAPIAVAGAIWLFASGRRREALAFVAAVATAAIALPLLKTGFGRARPDQIWRLVVEDKPSFPSGHALGAAVTFPLLGRLTGRRLWLAAGIAMALLIGLSRVFLGVHWLSDVLGGWLLGAAWVCATLAFLGSSKAAATRA
jgi:undecaprenyl-diphosphatase